MAELFESTPIITDESEGGEEIDVTNLIDPLVILLALFMIISQLQQEFSVLSSRLVHAPGDAVVDRVKSDVEIRLTPKQMIVNGEPIPIKKLAERLTEMRRSMTVSSADLLAEEGVMHEQGLKVRAVLKRLGIRCHEIANREKD
jgi:biopolymer transport protein ExbD